jgi:hypothetical protein
MGISFTRQRFFAHDTPFFLTGLVLRYCTPTYILYHGKATGKDKAGKKIWTRIGAVWPNKSGKGFNITWEYLPLGDGVTVMLPYDTDRGGVSPPTV